MLQNHINPAKRLLNLQAVKPDAAELSRNCSPLNFDMFIHTQERQGLKVESAKL
jgi:hypothetical protein